MPPQKTLKQCEGVPLIEDESHIPMTEEAIAKAMD
jgi:hypothetical protein